jgi:hypothetical protein
MSKAWLYIREWTAPVLDHRFCVVAVVYLAGVLALLLRNWPDAASANQSGKACGNTDATCWVAAVKLCHNHLIAHGELRASDSGAARLGFYLGDVSKLEGKYVKPGSISAGEAVTAEKLMDRPALTFGDKRAAIDYPVPADSRLGLVLDADTQLVVDVTDSDLKTTTPVQARVIAIVCAPGDKGAQPACDAILDVPSDKRDLILKNKSSLQAALGLAEQSKGETANGTPGVAKGRVGTPGSKGPGPTVDGGARTSDPSKKHQD